MDKSQHREEFMKTVMENENIIHKLAGIYASTREEREDLRQEIIYQLWKSWESFREESRRQTWMYRVALNTALHHKRKKPPLDLQADERKMNARSTEEDDGRQEDLRELLSCIRKLNDLDRAIIFLWLEKNSYAEIGEVTGLSEKNISVKIHRIKGKLRECMNN